MTSVRFGAIHVLSSGALNQFTHRLSITDHQTGGRDNQATANQNYQALLARYVPSDPDVASGRFHAVSTGDLTDLNRELLVLTGQDQATFQKQVEDSGNDRHAAARTFLQQAERTGALPRIDLLA